MTDINDHQPASQLIPTMEDILRSGSEALAAAQGFGVVDLWMDC